MPDNKIVGILTDVGNEELGHIEMVATIIYQLTRNLSEEKIANTPFANYFVDHTTGVYPIAASGVPFDMKYVGIKKVGVTQEVLEQYGLDKPVRTVTFTDKVGGAQTFCIGAYNTYNGTYCAYKNGDKTTVYLLDGAFYTEFERAVESFVYHDDLPAFKPEGLKSLTLTQGDRTVTLTRGIDGEGKAVWHRSVNGEAPVTVAADLVSALELLVGDMDYLACLGVKTADFSEYGLHENTTAMTVAYEKTVSGVTEAFTFTLTLGNTDKYGYYYANPKDTTLTMLLGGSVFSKVMTYDDTHISEGDAPAETDTAA